MYTIELYDNLISLSNQRIVSYADYIVKIDSLTTVSENNLCGIDLEFMLICLEVAKNSANLWIPESRGGQGLYMNLRPNFTDDEINHIHPRSSGDGIIAADVGGAAGVFFGWGSTLIAIPGTNAAVATAIAWGAGYSSAGAALWGCGGFGSDFGDELFDDTNCGHDC